MAQPRSHGGEATLPLSALLSQFLADFAGAYQAGGAHGTEPPPLPLWANLLRLLGERPVAESELPTQARISRRALRTMVGTLERRALVTVEPQGAAATGTSRGKPQKVVRLTAAGESLRAAAAQAASSAERTWLARFDAADLAALRSALVAIVARLELELPHYPMPYGTADPSMRGGRDAVTVPRAPGGTTDGLPTYALVSQALMMLALEHEQAVRWPIFDAANILRFIPDRAIPLDAAPPLAGITGTGKSRLERHGVIGVKANAKGTPMAKLSGDGRRIRDAYLPTAQAIEQRWRETHGIAVVQQLRSALERLTSSIDPELPHFPVVVYRGGLFIEASREGP